MCALGKERLDAIAPGSASAGTKSDDERLPHRFLDAGFDSSGHTGANPQHSKRCEAGAPSVGIVGIGDLRNFGSEFETREKPTGQIWDAMAAIIAHVDDLQLTSNQLVSIKHRSTDLLLCSLHSHDGVNPGVCGAHQTGLFLFMLLQWYTEFAEAQDQVFAELADQTLNVRHTCPNQTHWHAMSLVRV